MHLNKITILALACIIAAASPAKANVFKWEDPAVQVSITFPDDWRRVANQQPDDVITIAAPGGNDHATCRLRVREDRRHVIYPRQFADAIQRTSYSRDFWEDYIGEYRASVLYSVTDNAGLGNAFASSADVSFVSPAGPSVQKRGMVYGGVYNDNAYILECSAENEAYAKWHHAFLSVLKSVEMRHEYTINVNGHYRKFQKDGKWFIHGEKPQDLYVY